MIYLDNAATTYPKPPIVANTVAMAMKKFGANPGRSGHNMSIAAATEVYRREALWVMSNSSCAPKIEGVRPKS